MAISLEQLEALLEQHKPLILFICQGETPPVMACCISCCLQSLVSSTGCQSARRAYAWTLSGSSMAAGMAGLTLV